MQAFFNNLTKIGVAVAVAGGVISNSLYTVGGGHRAVIFDRINGVSQEVIGEGTHFLIPWIQRPIIYDIRTRPRNIPVNTGSKDLQKVNITLRILYKPKIDMLPKIYTSLGLDFEERVLPSITYEVLKSVVAQFDASDLITQRELVSQKVNEMLTARAANFGLTLDDISLTHLTFGTEFSDAVEAKQVAQQEAERARYLVEKAEQEKLAAIISAEGDSQAASLLAKSFNQCGEGFIELQRIQTSEEIAHLLSKNKNVVYLPDKQNTLITIPS